MKFLFDFFPVLLFFLAYKLYGIYTATAVAIGASFLQVVAYWLKHKKYQNAHLITLAVLVFLGGATIILHDEMFLKWKPSVVNWIFAIAFLASQFIGNKTIIERMMGKNITLPAAIWSRLNISWVIFLCASGAINLLVAYNFDTDTWVNFKLFGMLGLTVLFIIAQGIYLSRYMDPVEIEKE